MTAREVQLGTYLRQPVCKVRTTCGEGTGGTFDRMILYPELLGSRINLISHIGSYVKLS